MKNRGLQEGVNPVIPVPLDNRGKVDTKGLASLVDFLACAGVHGVVVLGSMGELPYLSADERRIVVESSVAAANGRIQVIAGSAAFGTDEAVKDARRAVDSGADALMVPFLVYFKPRFEEVLDYYKRIAGESGVPIIYYNFPRVTHLDLTGEEIARIFEIENVVGIKESISDLPAIKDHISKFPKNIKVFSGSSLLMRHVIEMGGCGVICPIPCLDPASVLDLYKNAKAGRKAAADSAEKNVFRFAPLFKDIDLPIDRLHDMIVASAAGGPGMPSSSQSHARLKEALRLQGHKITAKVKAPLQQLDRKGAAKVKKILGSV